MHVIDGGAACMELNLNEEAVKKILVIDPISMHESEKGL
jgi:Ni,Fe-hydrogenase maturation factor